ncbi:MAG: putative sulfate exporter family transporter [Paracoccaceae bacterium]|jgi:uncharacterized integral membrane protein (TIGR00698 family)|nr:putative sulfate exporter family transporter [Paracoccaceae bacterium]
MSQTALAVQRVVRGAAELWPGVLICLLAALAAQFLSSHYGAPAMLIALLLGLALQSAVRGADRVTAGLGFAARDLLRLGVGLLGARISLEVFLSLGAEAIWLVVASILGLLAFSLVFSRLLGRGWRLAVLTGGAVSICGASAAVAIAAVLPRREHSDRDLSFTVFSVTLLSTVAMVVYPILGAALGLPDSAMALFLGATIHDVAQVVGAGFSVSEPVGETATTVKLIRVAMLAPFVMCLSLALPLFGAAPREGGRRPPILPWFVVLFAATAAAASFGVIPVSVQAMLWQGSRWLLLTAIVGVGLRTDLGGLLSMPPTALVLIFVQTLLLAAFVLIWITRWAPAGAAG